MTKTALSDLASSLDGKLSFNYNKGSVDKALSFLFDKNQCLINLLKCNDEF